MTSEKLKIKKQPLRLRRDPASVALGLLGLFSLLLILKNPDIAIKHMSHALSLCAKTVIPSLFPFMVLSELIVSGNAVKYLARVLSLPAKALFGISGEGAAAVIMGLLCGFPIGAKSGVSLYKAGKIDRSELSHILTFSNNPSSAFLISAAGVAMFGSRAFGVLLYAISLISALIIGVAGKYIRKKFNSEKIYWQKEERLTRRRSVEIFTSAITSSALSMLYICAFIVFFSTLVGVLEYTVNAAAMPDWLSALWFGFFEMTSGIYKAAAVSKSGYYLAAAIAGWSGLSVHFQIMSICADSGVSFRPYLLSKLAAALLNILLLAIFGAIFGLPA